MNKTHAIANRKGQIDRIVSLPDIFDPAAQCEDGETAYPVGDNVRDDTHYIKLSTGKANKRPATPCTLSRTEVPADGKTPVKLSQMRPDTHVKITGPVSAEAIMSGADSITFSVPGQYTLTATAPFPARPREITIHAT